MVLLALKSFQYVSYTCRVEHTELKVHSSENIITNVFHFNGVHIAQTTCV